MMTVLPDLWLDWCDVTDHDPQRRDAAALAQFRKQASPSSRILADLQPRTTEPRAPAWPASLRTDPGSLRHLLERGSTLLYRPDLHWTARLRLDRLLFTAVLIAPKGHGGLALTRGELRALTPRALQLARQSIGIDEDPASCPACAVGSWLEVLGTATSWSRGRLRELLHYRQIDGPYDDHRHTRPDPRPEWADWPDQPNLLPAIDRWGWLDLYVSLHPSSISALLATISQLHDHPDPEPSPDPVPQPRPIREIDPDEEAALLARADEVNTRVRRILAEFS